MHIDRECTDVNIVVRQYDASHSSLLDKHAPSKRIYVVDKPMNDWMTDDITMVSVINIFSLIKLTIFELSFHY